MTQGSFLNTPTDDTMGALGESWSVIKAPKGTAYCASKNCYAHATKYAPEDGKPYCDICVSDRMKEPKKEKDDPAKNVGVRHGNRSSTDAQKGY